jgi:ferredoxin
VLNPEELTQVAATGPNFQLRFAFSHPGSDDVRDRDFQRHGYVDVDWIKQELNLPSVYTSIPVHRQPVFYICGPPPMMQTVTNDLEVWQVPADVIHFEAFGPASIRKLKPLAVADGKDSQAQYSVEFRRSGRTINWQADSGSLLESATANDILLDCGCRCGDCGSCEIAVIDGEVEYPDKEPQFELQTGNCLTCIGVPSSNLILDA